MGTLQLIRSDYRKFRKYGGNFFSIVFFTQGFWAVFQYRVAHAVHSKIKLQPFRALFLFFIYGWQKTIEILTGISIPAKVQIGHSFFIGHFGGIFINANAVIGSNCNIAQNVTVGVSGLGDHRGVPIIGSNVFMGANSIIAGKITIGDNVLIGACSFVNTNVSENSVVQGVPAVVLSQKSSNGYI